MAQNLIDAVSDENLLWIFVRLNRFYSGQGLYALAKPWLEQCVSVVESRLGEEHPDVATSYNNLAGLYKSQGRYSEAEPLYQKTSSWQLLVILVGVRQRAEGRTFLVFSFFLPSALTITKSCPEP